MLPLHYGYKIWRKAEESNSIPLSENLVFKASRGTIPTALPSVNTLLEMCVSKHSSWMNPLALQPENASIRTNF